MPGGDPSSGDRPASIWQRIARVGSSALAAVDRWRLDYVYLAVALIWGVALVVLMPPLQVPDESAHFFRAWSITDGRVFPNAAQTETVPRNVASLLQAFPVGPIGDTGPYEGFPTGRIGPLLGAEIAGDQVTVPSTVPSRNPLAYLPQAAAVAVARIVHWSPLGAFYLARLFNLLAGVALTFLAVRLLPWGKVVLVLVALFPVTIAETASVSPDALLLGGAFLFTALCVQYSERARVSDRALILLLAVGVLLLTAKPGYFGLAVLVFLIRPRGYGSRRRYALWTIGILGAVLCVTVLMAAFTPLASGGAVAQGPAQAGADAMAQLRWVLGHPLGFLHAVIRTLGAEGYYHAFGMVGRLGWLSIDISSLAVALLGGLILWFMSGYPGDGPVAGYQRTVLLLGSLVTVLGMLFSVYVAMAAVGGPWVVTLQGRYFTPAVPLLLLGLYRLRLRRASLALLLLIAVLVLIALLTMLAIRAHYP
jgi:uncharacterized membrane protein